MKKSIKLLAISLAAMSVMALSVPAFAESEDVQAATETEITMVQNETEDAQISEDAQVEEDTQVSEDEQVNADEQDAEDAETPAADESADAQASEDNEAAAATDETANTQNDTQSNVRKPDYMLEDYKARVYVYNHNKSGTIEFKDTSFWDKNSELFQIQGIPLSNIIFQGDYNVHSITYTRGGGWLSWLYDNMIDVNVRGCIHFYFTDEEGDTYSLYSMNPCKWENHTVRYNSNAPKITKITWEFVF